MLKVDQEQVDRAFKKFEGKSPVQYPAEKPKKDYDETLSEIKFLEKRLDALDKEFLKYSGKKHECRSKINNLILDYSNYCVALSKVDAKISEYTNALDLKKKQYIKKQMKKQEEK